MVNTFFKKKIYAFNLLNQKYSDKYSIIYSIHISHIADFKRFFILSIKVIFSYCNHYKLIN